MFSAILSSRAGAVVTYRDQSVCSTKQRRGFHSMDLSEGPPVHVGPADEAKATGMAGHGHLPRPHGHENGPEATFGRTAKNPFQRS